MANDFSPQGIVQTAQTNIASAPDVGPLEALKAAYAADYATARDYIKSLGYDVAALTDDNGQKVRNTPSDLWIIPKDAPQNFDNNYIYSFGRKLTPGILGTVAQEAPKLLLSTAGGIGGGYAGAPLGPWGVGIGAATAAAGGNVLGEKANRKIGSMLFPKQSSEMTYPEMAKEAAIGAATELGGRYLVAPLMAGRVPWKVPQRVPLAGGLTEEKLGEKLATTLGEKPQVVPVGGNQINVSRLTGGNLTQQEAEVAAINRPIQDRLTQEAELLKRKLAEGEEMAAQGVPTAGPLGKAGREFGDAAAYAEEKAVGEDFGPDLSPEEMERWGAWGPRDAAGRQTQLSTAEWQALKDTNEALYSEQSARVKETLRDMGLDESSQAMTRATTEYNAAKKGILADLRREFPRDYPPEMTDEMMVEKLSDAKDLSRAIQSVRNRFSAGRQSGLSFEDVLGINSNKLIFLQELAAKRGRTGFLSDEGSKELGQLMREIGDLQAKMKGLQRIKKQFPTESAKSQYSAPINYNLRGAEATAQPLIRGAVQTGIGVGNMILDPTRRAYGRSQMTTQDTLRAVEASTGMDADMKRRMVDALKRKLREEAKSKREE